MEIINTSDHDITIISQNGKVLAVFPGQNNDSPFYLHYKCDENLNNKQTRKKISCNKLYFNENYKRFYVKFQAREFRPGKESEYENFELPKVEGRVYIVSRYVKRYMRHRDDYVCVFGEKIVKTENGKIIRGCLGFSFK